MPRRPPSGTSFCGALCNRCASSPHGRKLPAQKPPHYEGIGIDLYGPPLSRQLRLRFFRRRPAEQDLVLACGCRPSARGEISHAIPICSTVWAVLCRAPTRCDDSRCWPDLLGKPNGVVMDPNAAVIPAAEVTITNVGTQIPAPLRRVLKGAITFRACCLARMNCASNPRLQGLHPFRNPAAGEPGRRDRCRTRTGRGDRNGRSDCRGGDARYAVGQSDHLAGSE